MQDKIPDALIAAFERQYGVSIDHPDFRNERLAMRYGWNAAMEAKPCLHQIQEPAPSMSMYASKADYEEATKAAPAAVAAPAQALTGEARAEAIKRLAPIRAKLAAAAVAVPDELNMDTVLSMADVHAVESLADGVRHFDRGGLYALAKDIARAALAATPAAAAPVVLPEPDAAIKEVMGLVESYADAVASDMELQYEALEISIKSKLLALLAGVSAPAAQAVPEFCHAAQRKLQNLLERGYTVTGYALEKPVDGTQPDRGFINHGGFVGWWWDGQSPLAQADARDAVRYRYLTQQLGDYCITDAMENTSGVYKAGAADSVIDAAIAAQAAQQGGDKQ